MPRPTKAFRRTRLLAAQAYKRGEKEQAYKLWEQASKNLKEYAAKKRNKKAPPQEAKGDEGSAPA